MADERLRGAERLAALGGTEERARMLRERVRSGQSTDEDVRLAAFLGDPAAAIATGEAAASGPLAVRVEALGRWGPVVCALAAATACRAAFEELTARIESGRVQFMEEWTIAPELAAVRAVEDWARSPGPEHAAAVRSAVDAVPADVVPAEVWWGPQITLQVVPLCRSAARESCRTVDGANGLEAGHHAAGAVSIAAAVLNNVRWHKRRFARAEAREIEERARASTWRALAIGLLDRLDLR